MLFPAAAFGQLWRSCDDSVEKCHDLGENPVRVIAHKFAGFPPACAFRVVNGSENPIGVIDLGTGYDWFLSSQASLPHRVSAPADWDGIQQFRPNDQCGNIRYRWMADDGNDIPPGESPVGCSVLFSHIYDSDYSIRTESLTRIKSPRDLRVMPFVAFGPGFSLPCYVGVVEDSGGRPPIVEDAMRPPPYIVDYAVTGWLLL